MKIYGYTHRNIGPYSNVPTIINFEDKASMNMMIADNGVGKTTMIWVLKLGLYHDLAYSGDVKVDEIANDINKNGEIIVELNSRGRDWTIITNFSPNKIRVFEGCGNNRSAEPLDKGGMPETKRYIRDQILDIPFYIFDNILSIDVSEFKSLLTLDAEDTRKIRDRIFGFSVFNDMSAEIKKRLNVFVDDRKMADYDLEQHTIQHAKISHDIEEMKNQIKSELKVDDLKTKIEETNASYVVNETAYNKFVDDLKQVTNDHKHHENTKIKYEISQKTLNREELNQQLIKNLADQEKDNSQITKIQEYAEVKNLIDNIATDKSVYNKKIPNLTAHKTAYEKYSLDLNILMDKRELLVDAEIDKNLKIKYDEWVKLPDTIADLKKQKIKEESRIKILRDGLSKQLDVLQMDVNTISSAIITMTKHLESRKDGKCPECGTEFTSEDDSWHCKQLADDIATAKINKDIATEKINKAKTEINQEIDSINKITRDIDISIQIQTSREAVLKSALLANPEYTLEKIATIDVSKIIDGNIEEIDKNYAEIKALSTKANDDANLIRGQLTSLKEKITKDNERLKTLQEKFKEEPTGNIEAFKEHRASLIVKYNELHKQINNFDVQIQVLQSKISETIGEPKYTEAEASTLIQQLPINIDKSKSVRDELNQKIFEYNKSIEIATNAANLNLQSAHMHKQRDDLNNKIKDDKKKLSKLKIDIERQEHLLEIIKRSKDEVLRINIPYINHMVVDTCKRIGVTQMLTFDDSFKPHIFRGNREVSLKSASLGQRKKMNFAVLISITKFLKLRYGGLNIIFYDEMFSSIDEKGRPHMLEIIRQEIVENLGIHVWITNHFFIPNAQFDNYIMIESKNGFSHSRKIEAGELLNLDTHREKELVA